MKDNSFKNFLRETYDGSSPIPYIITVQAVVFVLLHIVDLLSFSEITDRGLFAAVHTKLSLPAAWTTWWTQPWSFLTHSILYNHIFQILFDCLWLFWIGNIFLSFLQKRQFWTVFGLGIFAGALLYLLIGTLHIIPTGSYWSGMSLGLIAIIVAVTTLLPTYEMRLFLFGNVKLRTIAIVFVAFELLFTGLANPQIIVPMLFAGSIGWLFVQQLQSGRDWSTLFSFKKRPKLKVIHRKSPSESAEHLFSGPPSQEQIDQILDKISKSGYDSLTSSEKEVLFKASKQDQE